MGWGRVVAVAVERGWENGAATLSVETRNDPLERAVAEAGALVAQHARALLRIHQQLRAAHQTYLARLQAVDARLLAIQSLERSSERPTRGRGTLVAVDTVGWPEQQPALRQEQEWLAERLVHVAAAARRIQAVARQSELSGGFLDGDVAESDGGEELTELAQLHALQAQEDERRRLARDVHDGPAQVLANAIFELGYCKRLLGQDADRAEAGLERLEGDLRTSLAEVRQFIHDLQPGAVAEVGLATTLQKYLDDYAARTSVNARLDVEPGLPRLPAPVELGVFRIVQEALQNVRKHSQARAVEVRLARLDEALAVTVQDDGVGFDPEVVRAEGGHFGLTSMADRARLIRAEITVAGEPGRGARVSLVVPTADHGNLDCS